MHHFVMDSDSEGDELGVLAARALQLLATCGKCKTSQEGTCTACPAKAEMDQILAEREKFMDAQEKFPPRFPPCNDY